MARCEEDIPSLKWPIAAVIATGWTVISNITDFTVGIDSSNDAAAAVTMFPFVAIMFGAACFWYGRRVKARKAWREQRMLDWVVKRDLTPPSYTDWEAFEREIHARAFDPTKQNGKVER